MSLTPETVTQLDPGGDDDAEAEVFPAAYGQYTLLHRLARGGMGNVYLAKTGGVVGIEKHCVVKTLRRRFTHDPDYVARFMQEARVVVQLSHRNICPVFDVGRVGTSYYLAMELVLGRDLRSVQLALADRGTPLPPALALHVTGEVLDALDYAHRHVDNTTGEPLHLVHRDVSPQNIMISIEGEVKLIDFGLAEIGRPAEAEASTTSTVMGKMSYMAPEHARGDAVDARADQFAAAVVAYELFTGARYYAGLTPEQVWQQAGPGQFKPAGIASLPKGLREVLEKALSPSRDARYATCGDFRDALLAWARKQDLHMGARELRALTADVFVEDLREMRELLQRFAGTTANADFLGGDTTVDGDALSIASSAQARTTLHDPTELVRASGANPVAPAPAPSSRGPALLLAGVIGAAALVGALGLFIALRDPAPAPLAVPVEAPVEAAVAPAAPAEAPPPTLEPASKPEVPAPPKPAETAAAEAAPGADAAAKQGPASTGPAKSVAREPRPEREPRHRRREERREPKVTTFREQVAYVGKQCPDLPCTTTSQRRVKDLASLSPADTQAFMKTLRACYDTCRSLHR